MKFLWKISSKSTWVNPM